MPLISYRGWLLPQFDCHKPNLSPMASALLDHYLMAITINYRWPWYLLLEMALSHFSYWSTTTVLHSSGCVRCSASSIYPLYSCYLHAGPYRPPLICFRGLKLSFPCIPIVVTALPKKNMPKTCQKGHEVMLDRLEIKRRDIMLKLLSTDWIC